MPGRFPVARCFAWVRRCCRLGLSTLCLSQAAVAHPPPVSGVGLRSVAMRLLGGLPACCSLPDLYPTFTPGGPVGPLFGRSQGMFSSALPCCTIACAYYVAWALLPCLEHLVLGEPVDGEHTLGPVLGHLLWTWNQTYLLTRGVTPHGIEVARCTRLPTFGRPPDATLSPSDLSSMAQLVHGPKGG